MWVHTSQSSQDSDSGHREINNCKQLGEKTDLFLCVCVYTCAYTHTHKCTYKVSFGDGGGKRRMRVGKKQGVGIQGTLNSKGDLEGFHCGTKPQNVILQNKNFFSFLTIIFLSNRMLWSQTTLLKSACSETVISWYHNVSRSGSN